MSLTQRLGKRGNFSKLSEDRMIKTIHVTPAITSLTVLLTGRFILLKDQGFEIIGYSAHYNPKWETSNTGFRIFSSKFLTRKMNLAKDIGFLLECYHFFRKEKPVIINTYGPKPGIYARISARLAGVPVVVHTSWGFFFDETSSSFRKLFVILLEKFLSFFCDYIFSVNREDLALMHDYRFKDSEKLGYLGNGTDIRSQFNPDLIDESFIKQAKKRYRLPQNSVVIGIVGRLTENKGYREYFQAASLIKKKHDHVEFIVIGPLDFTKGNGITEKELKELEEQNIIKYYGLKKHDEMPEIYSIIDIMVLPSYREGFPRSLVEAASMGKPIVATNIRGCREAVDNGINGYLVPVRNSLELAGAIEKLISNRELREEMGKNSRKKAIAEFDERLLVDKIAGIYRSLLAQKMT